MGLLRLFLALDVLLEHFDQQVFTHRGMKFDSIWVFHISGGRAVMFFYIISGFLISYALAKKYPPTAASTLAFYWSRFLRIYPLWWAVLAFCYTASLLRHLPIPTDPIPAVFFVSLDWIIPLKSFPSFDWDNVLPPATAVAWTLGAEVTFYLMAPWILRSSKIAGILFAASLAVRAAIMMLVPIGSPGHVNLTMFFFPATLMFFLLGHFAARIGFRLRTPLWMSLILLCASMSISFLESNPITFDTWRAHLSPLLFAMALPGLFAVTKDSKFFNFLGDLTYPLYLTHLVLIGVLFWPFAFWHGLGEHALDHGLAMIPAKESAEWLCIIIFSLMAIVTAVLAHYAVERPLRLIFSALFEFAVQRRTTQSANDETFSTALPRIVRTHVHRHENQWLHLHFFKIPG